MSKCLQMFSEMLQNDFFSDCEKDNKPIFNDIQKKVGHVLNICESEIKEIILCGDCYLNREKDEGFFTRLCTKPHLILWVKFKQFPYWPAKLIKVKNGRSPLEVYFFGEHTTASVSCQNVLLYTETNPNEEIVSNQQKIELEAAIDVRMSHFNPWYQYKFSNFLIQIKFSMTQKQEAAEYIKNIEEKYGEFHFAKLPYKRPMREMLDTKHLDEMIPGYRNSGKIVQLNGRGDSTKNQTTPENIRNASIQIQNENRKSFQFPAEIQAKLRECLECFSAQKAEIAHLKAEIARVNNSNKELNQENNSNKELIETLKRKNSKQNFENAQLLAKAKLHAWCSGCLTKMSWNTLCCQDCVAKTASN